MIHLSIREFSLVFNGTFGRLAQSASSFYRMLWAELIKAITG